MIGVAAVDLRVRSSHGFLIAAASDRRSRRMESSMHHTGVWRRIAPTATSSAWVTVVEQDVLG